MQLTRAQAIKKFRDMWNWIADETEKRDHFVSKEKYFDENNETPVLHGCYLCEYADQRKPLGNRCIVCPIDFDVNKEGYVSTPCIDYDHSPYNKWRESFG